MEPRARRRLSADEYLAIERVAAARSEFLDGEMFAMAGASREHNLLAGNCFASLHTQLAPRDCEVYMGDMRVRITEANLYTYPDLVVVCGQPEWEDARRDTLLNPQVIFEVLSPTTESYDRGMKFVYYRTLPSLSEYLMLSPSRPRVEHYRRRPDGSWVFTETGELEAEIEISSIACRLRLADLYRRVSPTGL